MTYTLYTDGGSRGNPGKSACAFFVFKNDEKNLLDFGGEFLGTATNNVAEYKGLIAGLNSCSNKGIKKLTVKMDSELIVKQVGGEYKVKEEFLKRLHKEVLDLLINFDEVEFIHVPRAENSLSDKLVNLILDVKE